MDAQLAAEAEPACARGVAGDRVLIV